jgi:transcriptional regulator with XRE-family HTH domain
MTLGMKIYEKRKEKGLTQEALAEKLGVSAQAVSKWENGATCPDIALLPKLAKIFDITVDALLSEEDEPVAYVAPTETRKSIDDMVLRINVNDGGNKVKVNLPLALFRAMMASNPDNVNINLGKSDFKIDWKMIISLVESGVVGKLVEIEGDGGETVAVEVV